MESPSVYTAPMEFMHGSSLNPREREVAAEQAEPNIVIIRTPCCDCDFERHFIDGSAVEKLASSAELALRRNLLCRGLTLLWLVALLLSFRISLIRHGELF